MKRSEFVNQCASEMVEEFKQLIEAALSEVEVGREGQVDVVIHEKMGYLSARAVEMALRWGRKGYEGRTLPCACGNRREDQGVRRQHVGTLCGRVRYQRHS